MAAQSQEVALPGSASGLTPLDTSEPLSSLLALNPRKQEGTEVLQSSPCSCCGAAPSLHQNLQTQSLSSSRAETTPCGERVIVNMAVFWSPSQPLWLKQGKEQSAFSEKIPPKSFSLRTTPTALRHPRSVGIIRAAS